MRTRKQRRQYKKYSSELCDDSMTFEECELAILRNAVDDSENLKGRKIANSDEIQKMLNIVEEFIVAKKLMLYGGTAINNILPKYAQFYNRDIEIPDYDFYSPDALTHVKELADIFYKAGYVEVEAKAGIHMGTFKVFVNFIPIADITQMHSQLYSSLLKESIIIAGIHYAPPNYLRMSMYLELSRPVGDVSRWEKIFKRLVLLNKHYPFKNILGCEKVDFYVKDAASVGVSIEASAEAEGFPHPAPEKKDMHGNLYIETRDNLINQGVVFFGGYATSLYSRYMPPTLNMKLRRYPDFDVLSEEPAKCADILREHLKLQGFRHISLVQHEGISDIIPPHTEVRVKNKSIVFIFKPIACHSYNKITIKDKEINIASIDTILAFYLSFLYADMKYYDKNRLLCMAKFLFDLEEKNRLSQRGLLKRFSLSCYGKQETLEDIRSQKARKYKELAQVRGSKEYEMWFLKYVPYFKYEKEDGEALESKIEHSIRSAEERNQGREANMKGRSGMLMNMEKGEDVVKTKTKAKAKKERGFVARLIRNIKTRKNRKSEFLF